MGDDKRKLNEQLDRLQQELPKPAAKPIRKLRRPGWKWVRIPAGVLLMLWGIVSTTPALNSRFAAGLALLAIDVPFLRRPTARLIEWGLDKWHAWRDRLTLRDPHPEERADATAEAGVSKDGGTLGACCYPSRRAPFGRAPQDEVVTAPHP